MCLYFLHSSSDVKTKHNVMKITYFSCNNLFSFIFPLGSKKVPTFYFLSCSEESCTPDPKKVVLLKCLRVAPLVLGGGKKISIPISKAYESKSFTMIHQPGLRLKCGPVSPFHSYF